MVEWTNVLSSDWFDIFTWKIVNKLGHDIVCIGIVWFIEIYLLTFFIVKPKRLLTKLLLVAVVRQHVGVLNVVGWDEGPWALVTPEEAAGWSWEFKKPWNLNSCFVTQWENSLIKFFWSVPKALAIAWVVVLVYPVLVPKLFCIQPIPTRILYPTYTNTYFVSNLYLHVFCIQTMPHVG